MLRHFRREIPLILVTWIFLPNNLSNAFRSTTGPLSDQTRHPTTKTTATGPSVSLWEASTSSSRLEEGTDTKGQRISFDDERYRRPRRVTAHEVAARAVLRNMLEGGGARRYLENDPMYNEALKDYRDRNLAKLIVTTVERRIGQIDKVLDQVLMYPPRNMMYRLRLYTILRIGAAQLLFFKRQNNHAAVKESVKLLHMQEFYTPDRIVGKANAVLRKICNEGEDLLQNYTSYADNVAPWLLEKFHQQWGEEITDKIILQQAAASNYIDMSVRVPEDVDRDEFIEDLAHKLREASSNAKKVEVVQLPHGNMLRTGRLVGAMQTWPGYQEGVWWRQDVSATLPALALCNGLRRQRPHDDNDLSQFRVVDMCSAPGGKCAQMLELGVGHVEAVEASQGHLKWLANSLRRLGYTSQKNERDRVSVVLSDGLEYYPSSPIDGILLNVPCTAAGFLDSPAVLRTDGTRLHSFVDLQRRLLEHCIELLPVGGVLVYATCSLLREEGEIQIEQLLSSPSMGHMKIMPVLPDEIPGFSHFTNEKGWVRVLPGVMDAPLDRCGGFFVARLVRVE